MPLLAYMCCTDHPPSLPLIQPAFDLMDQHVARPAVFSNLFGIPNMLIYILHLVHQGNMVVQQAVAQIHRPDSAMVSCRSDRREDTRGMSRSRPDRRGLFRRLSQAQIGAVSAPICAFYHHSFGGFSIVSVRPARFFCVLGQNWVKDSNIRRGLLSYSLAL